MGTKTLLVITDGFPQAGTNKHKCNFVKEYVDIVKEAFKEVIVISPQPFFPEFLSHIKIFKKYSYNSNFHDYSYDNVRIFYPNFFTLPISFLRNKNPDLALNVTLKIIEKYSISFDMIHAHFIHFGGHIGTKLKQIFHKKTILTCHDSPIETILDNEEMKQEFIEIFRLSDATTSFGGNYEKINNYFTVNQINTPNLQIDNFVNTSIFLPEKNSGQAKEKIGFQADDKIILNVGNIVFSHKGQTDILSIMQNLIKRNNKIQLVLIGDGQDKEELVRLIGENPCHSHIHYLGAKDNREIIPYLQAADIFAFPSRHESFGIVQIEALSCGCPVVGYKNGGSEFIVRDGRLGALIEKQDKNLLEENIINVLQKQYDKQYLHDYVCTHFSGDAIKKKLLDLYFN